MWRTETPVPEPTDGRWRPDSGGAGGAAGVTLAAGKAGKLAARLSAYGVATVGITMLLLRPRRAGARAKVNVFMGAGLVVALVKALVTVGPSAGSGGETKAAIAAPEAPAVAAVAPRPRSAAKSQAAGGGKLKPARRATALRKATGQSPSTVKRAPHPANAKKRPAPAVAGSIPPNRKPVSTIAAPARVAAPAAPLAALGPDYVDRRTGYAMRFPAGWVAQRVKGSAGASGTWLVSANDGKSASITLGLAPRGARTVIDQQNLDALTRSLRARRETVQSSGFGTVAGRRCIWHKLAVRSPAGVVVADGAARPACTGVEYFVPLPDGRALMLRVVARQETFAATAPRLKQSLDSLRLLTPRPGPQQVAGG